MSDRRSRRLTQLFTKKPSVPEDDEIDRTRRAELRNQSRRADKEAQMKILGGM
jgi:hypothetical protein